MNSATGLIWRDCHHRFRLPFHDVEQCRFHRRRIAFERARGDQRHIALGQRPLHAFKAGKTKGIVLIEDCNFRDAEILGQMLDPGLGLLKIRSAHIDDIAVVGIAQELGAGKGADERHFGSGCDRLTGLRCRRAHRADQGEHLILVDDLLAFRLDGFFRFVAVVARFEFELTAGNPAVAIGLVEGRQDALAHALAQILGRSGECRDLPEDNLVAD